jgi:hypothetical protein
VKYEFFTLVKIFIHGIMGVAKWYRGEILIIVREGERHPWKTYESSWSVLKG